MEYMSVTQVSELWGISVQRVRYYCRTQRIPGVKQFGKSYWIPRDSKRPEDLRRRREQEEQQTQETVLSQKPAQETAVENRQDYERFFLNALETIPSGIIVIQKIEESYQMIFCNRAAEKLLPQSEKFLAGSKLEHHLQLIHPQEQSLFVETLNDTFVQKIPKMVQFRYWNGCEYRWLQLSLQISEEVQGKAYGVGSLSDVSSEYRVIEDLKLKTQLLEKSAYNARIHYVTMDVESGTGILDSQTQQVYGLDSNILNDFPESVCRPDILCPDDYQYFCDNYDLILQQKEQDIYFNVRLMGGCGTYAWRRIHLFGICGKKEELIKIEGTSIEIDHNIKLQQSYAQALEQNDIASWEYNAKQNRSHSYGITSHWKFYDENSLICLDYIASEDISKVKLLERKLSMGTLQQQITISVKVSEGEFRKARLIATGMYEYDGQTIQNYLCTVQLI